MPRYVTETYSYDGGFDVVGRVVCVLNHQVNRRRVSVLVEKPDSSGSDGVSSEVSEAVIDDTPPKTTFFCNEEKASGGLCTREVDNPDDKCWQHEDSE